MNDLDNLIEISLLDSKKQALSDEVISNDMRASFLKIKETLSRIRGCFQKR